MNPHDSVYHAGRRKKGGLLQGYFNLPQQKFMNSINVKLGALLIEINNHFMNF